MDLASICMITDDLEPKVQFYDQVTGPRQPGGPHRDSRGAWPRVAGANCQALNNQPVLEAGHGTHPPFPDHRPVLWSQSSTAVGRCWGSSPGAALSALRDGSSVPATRTPGCCWLLSLAYFVYLGRTGYPTDVQWLAEALLLAGVLAQSGGSFLHMGTGQEGRGSVGTALTRAGVLLIAEALIILAADLITHG